MHEQLGSPPESVETVIAQAGARSIVIAGSGSDRALVTVVTGRPYPRSLEAHVGWDLPMRSAKPLDAPGGPRTVIVEDLPLGVSSTSLPASNTVPRFVTELAERVVGVHAAGGLVGRVEPSLVFVDPAGGALAGVAQRPIRAADADDKPDGTPPLFDFAYWSRADVTGVPASPADDVFRLALLIRRWRDGIDALADLSPAAQLGFLAAGHAFKRGAATDPLGAIVDRALDPRAPQPTAADILEALRAATGW